MFKVFVSFFLFVICLATASESFAQSGFSEYQTKDSIRIQYRWSRQNPVDPMSNAALSLRLTNNTSLPVVVALSVNFFRDKTLMFESRDNHYCLMPGQSLRGALANMRFMAEGVTLEMTREPWFSWEITGFSVEKVASCN
jgi:hypothetical protein